MAEAMPPMTAELKEAIRSTGLPPNAYWPQIIEALDKKKIGIVLDTDQPKSPAPAPVVKEVRTVTVTKAPWHYLPVVMGSVAAAAGLTIFLEWVVR
jgi:hypothetical protein